MSELTEPQLRALKEGVEALRYYSKCRTYGIGEHSIFVDDSQVARKVFEGGLLESALHDLDGEITSDELLGDRGREVLADHA